jgi:hypothetical protein
MQALPTYGIPRAGRNRGGFRPEGDFSHMEPGEIRATSTPGVDSAGRNRGGFASRTISRTPRVGRNKGGFASRVISRTSGAGRNKGGFRLGRRNKGDFPGEIGAAFGLSRSLSHIELDT